MDNPTIIITFHRDSLQMDISAREMPMDFAISLLERAKRQCENLEKVQIINEARRKANTGVHL